MSYAIKEKNKQVYVAKEQFGIAVSLMLAREDYADTHYHPKEFATEQEAKDYLKNVVLKTRTGRRHIWEIVTYR